MSKILVIEDDVQFRAMLTQMLAQDKHQVSEASSGDEGLRMFAANPPDLLITDILMPGGKDGIDVIRAVSESGRNVPVIAISGGRRSIKAEFNLDSAKLMGVKVTLPKPFTRETLRAAIKTALA